MVNKIKENWNAVDERCPICNQVTKRVIGLNKQSIKRLFGKPTLNDMIILIMMIGCLFVAWAYNHDMARINEILQNPEELCMIHQQNQMILDKEEGKDINLDDLILNPNNPYIQNGS